MAREPESRAKTQGKAARNPQKERTPQRSGGLLAPALIASAVLIAIIVALVTFFPSKDICSDDVRGYENLASSSLNATRENLSKIKGSLTVEERQKVPTQLDGLTATNFQTLKACDTQCKLLGQCLRFVFMTPPSQACPTEYADYKLRVDSAMKFLDALHQVEMRSGQATQNADALKRRRQDIEDLEQNSSGATGGRLAVLQAQARQLESNVSQQLSDMDHKITELLSN
jgi:hypothetical protein